MSTVLHAPPVPNPSDQAEHELDMADVVAVVGHELRTPLATILAATEVLSQPGGQDVALPALQRQVQRLMWLFNASLRVSELIACAPRDASATSDVRGIVSRLVEVGDPVSEPRIRVTIPDDLPSAAIEPEAFALILNNLLNNALKHSYASSICVSAGSQGERVLTYVADNGIGISPNAQHHTRRSDIRRAEGAGLGLYLARRLAQAFSGTVRLEDTKRGSRFVIDLPAVKDYR